MLRDGEHFASAGGTTRRGKRQILACSLRMFRSFAGFANHRPSSHKSMVVRKGAAIARGRSLNWVGQAWRRG